MRGSGTFTFATRPGLLPSTAASDGIELVIDSSMEDEAYMLEVSPRRVIVKAKDEKTESKTQLLDDLRK